MNSDKRLEDEEEDPPAESGWVERWSLVLVAMILRPIDASIGFLQGLRNSLEAPASEEEDPRDNRNRAHGHRDEPAPPQVVEAPKPRRLRSFLVFMLVLMIGIISGVAFSYRLLSKSVNSNIAIAEYLREEIAQFEKQEPRDSKEKAKYQKTIEENSEAIGKYREQIDDYENKLEALQNQLNAVTSIKKNQAMSDSSGNAAMAARAKRPTAPEKTGTCVMGSANAAANLANCVDTYNRK